MFRYIYIGIVLLTTVSCQFFQKEPEPIDFTTVDVYPVFENCDSTATHEAIKSCFETTLTQRMQEAIDTFDFNTEQYLQNAGLIIHLEIKNDGTCYIYEIEKINKVEESLPELQTQLMFSVNQLPKVRPAKKRGQFVTSRYMIPLYIEKE